MIMGKTGKPFLANLEPFIAAGIDPKTGLPVRMGSDDVECLFPGIKQILHIIDRQDAVNRFIWYNLPDGISSQMLETMLYYKGQLAFFYLEELDQFFVMPYSLSGSIDFYGRYNQIHPIPYSGGTTNEENPLTKAQADALAQIRLKPTYEVILPEQLLEEGIEALTSRCVLLKDYSHGLSQSIIPRSSVNDPIIDFEAELLPYMRTALIRATGVKGMRVGNSDEQSNVEAANRSMQRAALTGKPNIPIVGTVDFQELNEGEAGKGEEFLMALQGIDNFRLSTYGIDNGGLFQKRERKLVAEQEMNGGGGSVGLIMQDGLSLRQNFCDIVNSIWGLGIWCDVSETVSGADKNMDGELSDQQDQSGMESGSQPEVNENV